MCNLLVGVIFGVILFILHQLTETPFLLKWYIVNVQQIFNLSTPIKYHFNSNWYCEKKLAIWEAQSFSANKNANVHFSGCLHFLFVKFLGDSNTSTRGAGEPSPTAAGGGLRKGAGLCSGRQIARGFTPRRQMSGTANGQNPLWFY